LALAPGLLVAEPMRIATWGADLSRDGPGPLLRDIVRDKDEGVERVADLRPDILLLTDMDWDGDGAALAERLAEDALGYPYRLALAPNAGLPSGLDLDGNSRLGEARDAQGYGRFMGEGGMALLSRWPLGTVTDLSGLRWRDLPGARLPLRDGQPFPSAEAQAAQRLSSTGHWIVPVIAPDGVLTVLAWSGASPVFDGPEDMNGLLNADELGLWRLVLDGAWGPVPTDAVLLGSANLDPVDGEGLRADMAALLADARLQDPRPESEGARAANGAGQAGNPALDTVDWPEIDGPGNLRVSYVLPARSWRVTGSGVVWPGPDNPLTPTVEAAGAHRLVWVDIDR
jgi:hypothetical protein